MKVTITFEADVNDVDMSVFQPAINSLNQIEEVEAEEDDATVSVYIHRVVPEEVEAEAEEAEAEAEEDYEAEEVETDEQTDN